MASYSVAPLQVTHKTSTDQPEQFSQQQQREHELFFQEKTLPLGGELVPLL